MPRAASCFVNLWARCWRSRLGTSLYGGYFGLRPPSLMAGNVGLLKHASNVPQCALAIEEVFHRASFVHSVFQTLLISSERVSKLIEDPRIKTVTLTGTVGEKK